MRSPVFKTVVKNCKENRVALIVTHDRLRSVKRSTNVITKEYPTREMREKF
jgi:hypothetical protein